MGEGDGRDCVRTELVRLGQRIREFVGLCLWSEMQECSGVVHYGVGRLSAEGYPTDPSQHLLQSAG